jgi:hypothetical protein
MKTCLQNQRITPRLIPTSPTVVRDVTSLTRSDWALVAALGAGGAGFLAAALYVAGGL